MYLSFHAVASYFNILFLYVDHKIVLVRYSIILYEDRKDSVVDL